MTELEKARSIIDEADAEIAAAFEKRMNAVREIAAYKASHGLPVFDEKREKELPERNSLRIGDASLREDYKTVLRSLTDVSKAYQRRLISEKDSGRLRAELGKNSYDIIIKRGAIDFFTVLTGISGKALIVTDDGVPAEYARTLCGQLPEAYIYTLPQGEASKSPEQFGLLTAFMLEKGFTRKDCVIACGGGVPGDLAGFVSACYMRGIGFYNFPTTLLAQVDSSVGGKTAIDFHGLKNVLGAFHQPKTVVIDPDVLSTLPPQQKANGLAEAVKMSLTSDEELFGLLEREGMQAEITEVIRRSVKIKKNIVEADEKEAGLRSVLNFGHTVGHAIESVQPSGGLLHGECVALGMLTACSEEVRERLVPLLRKLGIKTEVSFDTEKVISAIRHDKKAGGETVRTVYVPRPGTFEFREMTPEEIGKTLSVIRE